MQREILLSSTSSLRQPLFPELSLDDGAGDDNDDGDDDDNDDDGNDDDDNGDGDGNGDGDDSHSACGPLIIEARQQHSRCGLPAL